MNDQFWKELRRATELVATSGVRRADGRGFKVYVVTSSNLVRIDISKNGSGEEQQK